MKIPINEKNRARIAAAIDAVQGQHTSRFITVDDVFAACTVIEKRLDIAPHAMIGVCAYVDLNARRFPACAKRLESRASTQFSMRRTATGWTLTEIERMWAVGPSRAYVLELTEAARAALLRRNTEWAV